MRSHVATLILTTMLATTACAPAMAKDGKTGSFRVTLTVGKGAMDAGSIKDCVTDEEGVCALDATTTVVLSKDPRPEETPQAPEVSPPEPRPGDGRQGVRMVVRPELHDGRMVLHVDYRNDMLEEIVPVEVDGVRTMVPRMRTQTYTDALPMRKVGSAWRFDGDMIAGLDLSAEVSVVGGATERRRFGDPLARR